VPQGPGVSPDRVGGRDTGLNVPEARAPAASARWIEPAPRPLRPWPRLGGITPPRRRRRPRSRDTTAGADPIPGPATGPFRAPRAPSRIVMSGRVASSQASLFRAETLWGLVFSTFRHSASASWNRPPRARGSISFSWSSTLVAVPSELIPSCRVRRPPRNPSGLHSRYPGPVALRPRPRRHIPATRASAGCPWPTACRCRRAT